MSFGAMLPAKICGKCSSSGLTNQMLGCDMCDTWFHTECVGASEDNIDPDKSWRCSRCILDEETEVASQRTRKSMLSSATSRSRKQRLLLELEEQRAADLQRRAEEDEIRKKRAEDDKEYFRQKISILLDEEDDQRSRLSSRASRAKVVNWLNGEQGNATQAITSSSNNVNVASSGLGATTATSSTTPVATSTPNTSGTVPPAPAAVPQPWPVPPAPAQGPQPGQVPPALAAVPHPGQVPPAPAAVPHPGQVPPAPAPVPQPWPVPPAPAQGPQPGSVPTAPAQGPHPGQVPPAPAAVPQPWPVPPAPAQGPQPGQVPPAPAAVPHPGQVPPASAPVPQPWPVPPAPAQGPQPGQVPPALAAVPHPGQVPPAPAAVPHPGQVPPASAPVPQPWPVPPAPAQGPQPGPVPPAPAQGPQPGSVPTAPAQGPHPGQVPPAPAAVPQPWPVPPAPAQVPQPGQVPPALAAVPHPGQVPPAPAAVPHPGQVPPAPAPVPQPWPVPPAPAQGPQPGPVPPAPAAVPHPGQVPPAPAPVPQPWPVPPAPALGPVPPQPGPWPAPQAPFPGLGPPLGFPNQMTPTGAQFAARQVMPRELPEFHGNPQDWPFFSSTFYNSTRACGFTDAENLARLSGCLKGHALTLVKNRLQMPESVPHVMEILRKQYGRPEVLIHSLMEGLRNVSAPKADDLRSIIDYGMAVRNLVDHMVMAQLLDHLCNPMLLHELVEKLPPQVKMQWAWYKRTMMNVNLATFGQFMTELVDTASEVTLPIGPQTYQRSSKAGRDNQKLYVHAEAEDRQPVATVASNQTKTTPGTSQRHCWYCSEERHEVAKCPQFTALDLDGRWKAVRTKGLCRSCLVPHRRWPCRAGRECGVDGCRLSHHQLLHSRAASEAAGKQDKNNESSRGTNQDVVQQNHHSTQSFCLFRYLPVTLENNGRKVETFAFLDDGCQTTLMEAGLAQELDIIGPPESLWLGWTGNIRREEKGSQRVKVNISGRGQKRQFKLSNVRTVQKLQLQPQTFQYDEFERAFPHLRKLPLHSYTNAEPKIIIGIEHARLLTSLKVREGKVNEPVATRTRLGWCVYGKQADTATVVEQLHVHTENQMHNRELHELMKKFFEVEEAAVATPVESADDVRARRILDETTRRVEGGFETGLLWKYDNPIFPDSYPLAYRRLLSLEKRLSKDLELKERVVQLVKDYEKKGYAHKITQKELESTDSRRVWYLPLGIVQNPKKPEKIRLIWDAAARVNGISFNDMLLKGPDMTASLFDVLLRFRQRPVAVCGDIREMFHQVRIVPEDAQSQRFLFREHPDEPPQIYVMDVATFGATCSPCAAQAVKNKNAKEFEDTHPKAAEAILNAHYVDDFLDSVDTVEEAVRLVQDVKYVHAQGGFDIRNFLSNSEEVLRKIGEVRSLEKKSICQDASSYVERVLGMVWKPAQDVFTFDTTLKEDLEQLLEQNVTPTKRQVLRLVMSLFDPCGFIAHFIVHGKILMQHIWRTGTDWDEKIAPELHNMWKDWTGLLKRLGEVEIPRCFFGETSSKLPSSIQLHLFVDASELAYSCAAYLRIVQAGVIHCVLVAAKTKVAPLKPLSIPRLELQAGVIGCRLLEAIGGALDLQIESRHIWTDSTTALAWITSDSRRYHPYVACRVGEILNCSNVDEWHYVPSKLNVADLATKWGNSGPEFNPTSHFYTCDYYLNQPVESWPPQVKRQWTTTEELRAVFHYHRELPRSLIDVTRFSSWQKLVRTAAYVLRSLRKLRGEKLGGGLTSDEMLQAEILLWRQVQLEAFPDEYCTLRYNKENPDQEAKPIERSSSLYQESPFLDDNGVMRMNSRIGAAPTAPFEAKYPIILPSKHPLTVLLVDSYHCKYKHINHATVHNEVQQRFRIPHLRRVVKHVASICQHCKNEKAVPKPPRMAPLPEVRLTPNIRAFTYTGVDYFGPLLVKQGRSLVKRWIALFTCLTTRAVHLEVVHSLSTQSCVMAIRRFVARRGSPAAIYSDNGTCFTGASKLLAQQIQAIHEDCAITFTNARTTWHFNPPAAPHMGGCWERLVRSVKAAMAEIEKHPHRPTDEVLETVLLEAESIVNSRPLTYIPLENEGQESLTPNHFLLYGNHGVVQPRSAMMVGGAILRDSWKLTQYLVDQFWKRWVREYLPMLTRRTKWFQPVKPLEVGDVVLVVDENKRNGWKRGRIIEVQQGKDKQVRRAVVQTSGGVLTRPATKLAVLDVQANRNQIPEGTPELHGKGDVENRCK